MLFVLAVRELESTGEAVIFYETERQNWSERLRYILDNLIADEAMVNKANAVAAISVRFAVVRRN